MAYRFNAPPNWPTPPAGWVPGPGWKPDPAWGPPPPGWQLWIAEAPPAVPVAPQQPPAAAPAVAAAVPASVATPRADDPEVPLFGARAKARELATEVKHLRAELERLRLEMNRLGVLPAVELEQYRERLKREIAEQAAAAQAQKADLDRRLRELRQQVVVTEETALLQEAGVYEYRHPLSDARPRADDGDDRGSTRS